MTTVKPNHKLSFLDRLSRLNFDRAAKLLGPDGRRLILRGARREVNLKEHVELSAEQLQVQFLWPSGRLEAVATLAHAPDAKDWLRWECDRCESACEHVGALFSTLLESKTMLGLAAPPPEREPAAELSEEELVHRALAEREQRARTERM